MKKKKVIDVMKSSASDGAVYEGWTKYFMKWSGFYCLLGAFLLSIKKISQVVSIVLITVPYNKV